MPDLTIFIPVLNEASILQPNTERLIRYLDGLALDYEIIIGSNGSSDATEAEGKALAAREKRVKFFALARPGPGAAFARAVKMLNSDALITLDMDLSVDLDFVPRALDLLPSYAVVVGSKMQGVQERTMARIAGSGLYVFCARLFLRLPYHDYSIGAKAFRREVLFPFKHLIDGHTAYVGNLIFMAHRAGFPVVEVPVACSDKRRSRLNLAHEGFYRVGWLLRLFWRYKLKGGGIKE
jgi:glycosyltransferase involved in cell wall biosynthesis